MPEAAAKSKSSRIVVPEKPGTLHRFAALLVYILVRLVTATLRYRWIDRSGLIDGTRRAPAIYGIWHNRLALSMAAYSKFISNYSPAPALAVMASASRDGGFLIAVLERFGVQPARGSTSRRGPQALRELTTWARRGYDLAITPDGPRGPRYILQEGIVSLAQLTGLPIVPATFNVAWKIQLKSWDKFQIPLPFSRVEMIFEKPVMVPRETSPEQREAIRRQLEQTMNGISKG